MSVSNYVDELLRDSLLDYSLRNNNKDMFMNLTEDDWKEHVIDYSLIDRKDINAMVMKPRRGTYKGLSKAKFAPQEIFYVTDIKMIGVADNDGNPQLIATVEQFGYKSDFPKEGDAGKLYLETYEGGLYAFNGEDYQRIKMGHYKGKRLDMSLL